ncbi:hypothetical protein RF11_07253 [Thelohanellus kitauei]|uniref:Thioredoxin domain-containing protein n=1 Tax=Thelohanellus kitauei TaxID=669202 RepID=A0A0C2JJU4_THEKT|nr:hypothetical protein RF11_07253 [Thelohanellus kitauei]
MIPERFLNQAPNPKKLVCIHYFAKWCTACESMAKEIQNIQAEFKDCDFKTVDIELNISESDVTSILVLPTVNIYFQNELKYKVAGYSEGALKDALENVLNEIRLQQTTIR